MNHTQVNYYLYLSILKWWYSTLLFTVVIGHLLAQDVEAIHTTVQYTKNVYRVKYVG